MFKKLSEYFSDRKLAKAVDNNPIYKVAAFASLAALKETGLEVLSPRLKEKQAADIATSINDIILSTDQVSTCRNLFIETVLGFSQYQVLVLEPI